MSLKVACAYFGSVQALFFIKTMAIFNVSCLNVKRDSETGCTYDCGGSNTYEACRQSFYLKQQNEILKQNSQQQQLAAPANNDQKIKDLESQSANLQKIIDQQNQQVAQLIQGSEQAVHKIEGLNLTNTILIAVLVVVVCTLFVIKIMKRKSISK